MTDEQIISAIMADLTAPNGVTVTILAKLESKSGEFSLAVLWCDPSYKVYIDFFNASEKLMPDHYEQFSEEEHAAAMVRWMQLVAGSRRERD